MSTPVCKTVACEPQQGCVFTPRIDGLACSVDNACITGGTCLAGQCVGSALSCDDNNACTLDFCDVVSGCKNVARTGSCGDSKGCIDLVCNGGKCVAQPTVCADGNPCTTDTCDANLNSCAFKVLGNGAACSADGCLSTASCVFGVCSGKAKLCDDGNPCTADTCTPSDGSCKYTLDIGFCDDKNPCTEDSCDANGCLHTANAAACDDGLACTTDNCTGGACVATAIDCTSEGFQGATCSEAKGCGCPIDTVPIDVDGVTACAPDFPAWGARPESPDAFLIDNGDGTLSDKQTLRMWRKAMPIGDPTWGTPPYLLCSNIVQSGFSDWRLPTVAELLTLFDYSQMETALAAAVGFQAQGLYKELATAIVDPESVQKILVDTSGHVSVGPGVFGVFQTLCVRLPVTPASLVGERFGVDAKLGTVLDAATKLTWQRDGTVTAGPTWVQADTYCKILTLDGKVWRLPTLLELASLVDRSQPSVHINANAFPGTPAANYWTSTKVAVGVDTGVWSIHFGTGLHGGHVLVAGKEDFRLRCVH